MHQSVWSDTCSLPSFPNLTEDKKTDVLIIGGGLCGLLCAYFLQKKGINYILLEGNRIASGITENTTAKITSQHGLIYADLLKKEGTEKAKMYLAANEEAIRKFEELCQNISCDFEKKSAYTYSLNNRAKIEEEVKAAEILGLSAAFCETLPLPLSIKGAICFPNQAQFHPLKFISEIAKELTIYENAFVTEIHGNTAYTEKYKIHAEKIIIATHFPFLNKHGGYFLKLYQSRSYVTAFENAPKLSGMYVDEADKGLSFRNEGNLLLLGGFGHRTGKKSGAWKSIESFAKKHYPEASVKYEWAAQDCMSLDGIPYIGQYGKTTKNLYVATGFNKWGMTSSMASAMLLSSLAEGKESEYAPVFSPQRSMIKPQLFLNAAESMAHLLIPKAPRCPHLGCALSWNRAERTWDCPCHGSRFKKDGTIIDNPAMENIKSKRTL